MSTPNPSPGRSVAPAGTRLALRAVPGWIDPVFPVALTGGGGTGPNPLGALGRMTNVPQLVAGLRSGVNLVDLSSDESLEVDRATLLNAPRTGNGPLRVLVAAPDPSRGARADGRAPSADPRLQEIPVHSLNDPDRPRGGAARPEVAPWALDLTSADVDPAALRSALQEGATLIRVPGSPLNAKALNALARSLPIDRGAIVIVDPFAQGRFDGRFLTPSPPFGSAPNPGAEADLRTRFQPVLRYGFLPRPRTRTLAQACLLYLLGIPRVVAVAIPGDRAETLQEALVIDRAPGPTEEEIRRIDELSEPRAP
jgi:hypothetical protein